MSDFVVVSVSKTKAARESFVDNGVEENDRMEERRCERMVVLPEPDSPLSGLLELPIFLSKMLDQTLTGRLWLDFLLDLPTATKLVRPDLRPRPWRCPICRHLGLWQRKCRCLRKSMLAMTTSIPEVRRGSFGKVSWRKNRSIDVVTYRLARCAVKCVSDCK